MVIKQTRWGTFPLLKVYALHIVSKDIKYTGSKSEEGVSYENSLSKPAALTESRHFYYVSTVSVPFHIVEKLL